MPAYVAILKKGKSQEVRDAFTKVRDPRLLNLQRELAA
jgi:hypothetical protein